MAKKKKAPSNQIARNKRATFDYFIEDTYEAGLELKGWEMKSIREGKVQITESYVTIKDGEMFLFGAHITPLVSASSHVNAEADRTRKLLLHKEEIAKLIGLVERKGYTLVALNLHWNKQRVKLDLGVGKGKKQHDKRATEKHRDWQRDKARIMKG